jgi:hypothetical protein
MDDELSLIEQSMQEDDKGPLYWPELAKLASIQEDEEEGSLFPVAFWFCDLATANSFFSIWSVQTILWHALTRLYGLVQDLQSNSEAFAGRTSNRIPLADPSPSLRPLEHRRDFAAPALNILQSVEYCLQEPMLDTGPRSIASGLHFAIDVLHFYPNYREEVTWAEQVLSRIQGRSLRALRFYSGEVRERLRANNILHEDRAS